MIDINKQQLYQLLKSKVKQYHWPKIKFNKIVLFSIIAIKFYPKVLVVFRLNKNRLLHV